jgi:hypothetical protein
VDLGPTLFKNDIVDGVCDTMSAWVHAAQSSARIDIAKWGFSRRPVSFVIQTTEDDASETQPKREFDRWRVAVDIVRRLREAGISCELGNVQNRH